MKLTKDVFIYPWTNVSINNCNTYLINEKHPILIDTGLSMCLNGVLEDIKKDGIDPETIELIISTHSHPDHFDGVKHFMQKDTKMALHRDEDTFLKETGKGFYNMFGLQMPDYRVDTYLQEGSLNINNTVMEIYHTPGHSPGSVSLYLPDSKTLIVGDVIFQAGVGRTDFPCGDGALLKKSIDKLSTLDIEHHRPGHGDILEGNDRVKRKFDYVAQVYYNII